MSLIRIQHNPSRGQLATFGAIWLLFFGILGAIAWGRADALPWALTLWATAVAVPTAGLLWPPLLRRIYVGMCYAALPLGWVVANVVLAAIFYLVLTPLALFLRVRGHDPMSRRDCQAASYWQERNPVEESDHYFRQF